MRDFILLMMAGVLIGVLVTDFLQGRRIAVLEALSTPVAKTSDRLPTEACEGGR